MVNDNVEGVNLVTNGDFSVDNDPPNGWSISGTLTTIRAISDMAALYSAATGEQIDVTAFAMISMAMTSMLQVKAQAAVFAVTPGLQPLAMMMLAMLPMFTGLIIMIKKTQTDINSQMKATSTTQMDSMLDGFPY